MSIIQLFSSMTAEQAASIIKEDLRPYVRSELERAFNEALGGEIEEFLLKASSPDGEKASLFRTEMIRPYQRETGVLEYLAQRLYLQGLTLSEVSDHLSSEPSGISRESVRKLVARLAKGAEGFRSRKLPECVAVYMDGTYAPLRRNYGNSSSVSKECIEVAIGVTRGGRRQVLDFRAVPSEGAGNWSDFLESLRKRGIGSPRLFVTDGLRGFPEAKRQTCLVHVQRNISQAVRTRDRKEIMDDFKTVYSKESRGECDEAFAGFCPKWAKPHPKLVLSLVERQEEMFLFYKFPKAMRKSIYTSNAAEPLNSIAKRKTRARIQYNSEDSVLIVLAKVYEDHNRDARPAKFLREMSEEERKAVGFDI